MRAGVYHGVDDIRIEDQPEPVPGPGEIVVELAACGVCGTDLMAWYTATKAPAVLGHEPVGVVVAAGPRLGRVEPPALGGRVFVHHHVPCFVCERCRAGRHTLCERFRTQALQPGGFAERLLVRAEAVAADVLPLPDHLSDDDATLVEPLGCVVRSQRLAGVGAATRLAVIGLGQMGLLQVAAASAGGCRSIVAADPVETRRAAADRLGAGPVAVTPAELDARAARDGAGAADVVIVCTSVASAVTQALRVVAPGGIVQLFAPGHPEEPLPVDTADLFFREINLQASYSAGPFDTREALRLLAGGLVATAGLVTHRFPLDRLADAMATASRPDALRVVVTGPAAKAPVTRAVVLYGPGDLRVEERPAPDPGPGEVVLDIRAATTCATDVKMFRRTHPALGPYPARFGHEFAGVVAAVGRGVDRLAEGDEVYCADSAPCGRCRPCLAGRQNLCDALCYLLGGFAERLRIPAAVVDANVHLLPHDVPLARAPMAEPLACVVHAVTRIAARSDGPAVVVGCGSVGLFLCAALRATAVEVIALDPHPERRELARRFGAGAVVAADRSADDVGRVRELTGGRGAAYVFEAVGRPAAWELAAAMAARGGIVTFVGGCPRDTSVTLPTAMVHYDEVTLQGSYHHTPKDNAHALDLLADASVPWDDIVAPAVGLDRLAGLLAGGRPAPAPYLKQQIRPWL